MAALEQGFHQDLSVLEGETSMRYVSSIERFAMKKGREEGRAEGREEGRAEGREEGRAEGREEGRAEGREEGRAEGREEGRAETFAELLRITLNQRFGTIPPAVLQKIEAATLPQLNAWFEAALTAEHPGTVFPEDTW
ncbi:hypothetical protein [Acanthopleuribacter pedis]|uniref:DUF4351 domain-containing protein n=1 Tax=Acanthopleuribacter pedis TaxID=442870 RepID=A0A8J7Q977_9BACT|nr:hypothetical protein [Acanthopleuribacter pedis]MBO1320220.1 hypothetical protein [Acanthopleuribacter pedis]